MAIYGECIGTLERTAVTIVDLGDQGCELRSEAGPCAIEGDLDLWIGAVGPFSVMAKSRGDGRYQALFREPLDQRIIAHFAHD